MIKTLSPYSNTAKTAEIMSRYRPIAPKPEIPTSPTSESSKIAQSPYLRNLWPQLQARPTRTRKRGRAAISVSPPMKRPRSHVVFGLSSPSHGTSPAKNLSLHGFSHGVPLPRQLHLPNMSAVTVNMENPSITVGDSSLVTLPLLPDTPRTDPSTPVPPVIDLNKVADISEENDVVLRLQGPNAATFSPVIAPQPVRPVGSSISVGFINEDPNLAKVAQLITKKPEEVEEEVESDALPAVISDSNNKVRMANSAYKEMVGQPECSWLDTMVSGSSGACKKRICGEVMLNFNGPAGGPMMRSTNGFSCWVRIEWGNEAGKKKNSVNAFCDVVRLSCESKDYVFSWRFHTRLMTRPETS